MKQSNFNSISLRGRTAYGIVCLKQYLEHTYPGTDFTPVVDMCCTITEDSNYIDESIMAFTEIIPEYLYEFDNFADAEFEYITENQYKELTSIIPRSDADLNSIMQSIRSIVWNYCYEEMEQGAPLSSKNVMEIIKIMNKHSLPLPDLRDFTQYVFEGNGGWGRFIKKEEYISYR